MKISYAIPVCNEIVEVKRLIYFLQTNMREGDEIVVIYDMINGTPEVKQYLSTLELNWVEYPFDGDFAKMKNALTSLCKGDYIFQIDADEVPNKVLIKHLHEVLEYNGADVIRVPRVNVVKGITADHMNQWGWSMDRRGWVNWPDLQQRIYRNNGSIVWKNKVHEELSGYNTFGVLPLEQMWSLDHTKEIDRQVKQNNYYENL